MVLAASIKPEDKSWISNEASVWYTVGQMRQIWQTRLAWEMALPLFNGVVESGCGENNPLFFPQCGVSECDSIKSRFSCKVAGKHLFCSHLAKTWQPTVTSYHFSNRQTELLDTLRGSNWGPPPPNFTYGSCVVELQMLLMLNGLSCWRATGVVITQQIGQFPHQLRSSGMEIWRQGNVNRVQLGFVPCLFPANRLCRILTLTYWNER